MYTHGDSPVLALRLADNTDTHKFPWLHTNSANLTSGPHSYLQPLPAEPTPGPSSTFSLSDKHKRLLCMHLLVSVLLCMSVRACAHVGGGQRTALGVVPQKKLPTSLPLSLLKESLLGLELAN